MGGYRIIITPVAGSDIDDIYRYIAQESPGNAAAMITRILDAIETLEQFPHRTLVEHRNSALRWPVRSLSVRPYIVYFRVLDDDRVVRILHVRHGARRPPDITG